jgi:hypothetical protein
MNAGNMGINEIAKDEDIQVILAGRTGIIGSQCQFTGCL